MSFGEALSIKILTLSPILLKLLWRCLEKIKDEPTMLNPNQSKSVEAVQWEPGTQLYFVWREVWHPAFPGPTAQSWASTKLIINSKELQNMGQKFLFFTNCFQFSLFWFECNEKIIVRLIRNGKNYNF